MESDEALGPRPEEEDRYGACNPCGKLVNLEDYSLEKCVECGCEICQDCEGPPVIYLSGRREARCVSCDPANSGPDPDEAYDTREINDPSQHVFAHLSGISKCCD